MAAFAAGRLHGVPELYVAGTAGLFLVGVSAVVVARAPVRLELERSVRPGRVHAGTASRVELSMVNRGGRRSPVLNLHDPVTGTTGARLLLAPLEARHTVTAAYRLPTGRRGIVHIGPLSATVSDPFGLTRRAIPGVADTDLTVLPRVDAILPLPFTVGNDPLAGAEHPNALGRVGEDFYALRPYVVGDDLRRVHWPSTARTGDLLVRQDEQPWQGRVTVLLDVRRVAIDDGAFEEMVTAAASVVSSCRHRGDRVRLVSTDGIDTGSVAAHAQLDALMEYLAVVEPTLGGTLQPALGALSAGGGTLVAVLGGVSQADLDAVVAMRTYFGGLTVVQFPGRSAGTTAQVAPTVAQRGRLRVVRVEPGVRFADIWNQTMGRSSIAGPAPAAVARTAARPGRP
ncbi:MAG: DUF58 domain-containing protein [Acidimicrobiales bacterium]